MSDRPDIVDELENPEEHYPANFATPKLANAILTALCQDAADEIRKLRKLLELKETK